MSATYTPKLMNYHDAKRGQTGQYPVWEVKSGAEVYYVERKVYPDLVPCGAKSVVISENGTVVCTFDVVKARPDGRNHRVESLPVSDRFYLSKDVLRAQQNGTYRAENQDEQASY